MSINHLAFNNLITNLTCCTNQGYIVYSLTPELEKKLHVDLGDGVGIMKMFNKTNIVVLVGGGDNPFKSKGILVLWDQKNKQSLIEIDVREEIKNVLINKDRIIAVLDKKICLFRWNGEIIQTKETYSNEKGLCVINKDLDVVATLGTSKGKIAIWKYGSDNYKEIEAHLTNIEALAISDKGKYVASASETGTLVKIFNTETGTLEYEFRRGMLSASIYDLCFNQDASIIACCSSNGTVHIYDIYTDKTATKNKQSMLARFQNVLPKYFSSQWSFKELSINNTSPAICAFDESNDLHIATLDGNYYKIPGKSGEFNKVTQGTIITNTK